MSDATPWPHAAVLFDLDGTLMETAPDIIEAVNRSLVRRGAAPAAPDLVRGWIGDGARALMAKACAHAGLPADPTAWEDFARDYADTVGQQSLVHEGVQPMLARLRGRGLRLAVLTNKEARFAHPLLQRHGLIEPFDLIVCGDTLPVKKPDPAVVHHALAALCADARRTVLVGDSVTDVRTARGAGVAVHLVRHGYPQGALEGANAPDAFIEHFDHYDPDLAPLDPIAR